MKSLLQSTTSLTLCMALVAPGMTPAFAQAQSAEAAACAATGE